MRDNPIHVKVFGMDPQQRERRSIRFFAKVVPLIQAKGTVLGAYGDGILIGIFGMVPPEVCRPTPMEVLRLLPTLLMSNSPAGVLLVRRWLNAWSSNDPEEAHWHLGPLAVDAALQGKGVGSQLMSECCNRMDALGAVSYLETDKAVNVAFYKKFDFSVTKKESILGVPNWFMRRP
jgi:ribosomal protein S18 acetylase RimI-like enzyme